MSILPLRVPYGEFDTETLASTTFVTATTLNKDGWLAMFRIAYWVVVAREPSDDEDAPLQMR